MRTELRKRTLIITGSNLAKGRYDLSESALEYFRERAFPIPPEAEAVREGKLRPVPVDVSAYPYKTQPWPHQRKGQELALAFKKFSLTHAMGAGKSKTLLDIIGFLFWKGLIKRALIVCPIAVFTEWPRNFERHAVFGRLVILEDTKKARKFLTEIPDEQLIVLVNYEKLASLEKELTDAKFGLIAADEATKVKNPRAQRTKVLARLTAASEYSFLMTGTPVSKNLVDVFGQYLVMDPYWFGRSFWFFRQRYCIMGGWMQHQITGYQRESELRRIIDTPSHRVLKAEALPNLPPKVFQERIIPMEPEQRRLYKETQKKFLIELQQGRIDIKNAASRIVKLQEIANGFVIADDGSITHISDSKVNGLMEAFDEIEPDEKIVVWCRFREDIRRIEEKIGQRFPERKVLTFHGDTKNRGSVLDEFRSTPGSVFDAQIQSGGMGIDLTCSHTVFFYSKVFEYYLLEQAQDRNHRPGQQNAVTYVDILAEDSVDLKIQDVLASKKTLSEWVMENKGRLVDFFDRSGRFRR